MTRAERIESALRGILEIGKRDTSNPKYDGYFKEAREALVQPAPACEAPPAPPFREVVEWLHHRLAAAQNLPYKEGDVCLECADVVRDQLVPLMERALAASVPPPTGGK